MRPRNDVCLRQSILYVLMATVVVACLCGCGGGSSAPPPTPTPTGTAVQVTFSGPAPLAAAEQIGTGAWVAATLQSGQLSFTLPQGTTTYAIAYVCPTYQGMSPISSEYILEATVQDGTSYTIVCPSFPTSGGTATGSVDATAISGTANVRIAGQLGYGTTVSGASGSFSATMVTGLNDIAAVALNGSGQALGVKIVRSQTVPGAVNGGSPITLAASDSVTTQTISTTNIPSGFGNPPSVGAEYITANNTSFGISNNSPTQYEAVPASEAQAGDYYSFSANTAGGTHQSVVAQQETTTVGPVTLAFPAPLTYVAPTAAAFPSFTVSYTGFATQPMASDVANIQWFAGSPSTLYELTVTATAAYQNGAATLVIPNLTSLSGFFATASSGTTVYWRTTVYGGTYPSYIPVPSSGTLLSADTNGTYTEP